MTTRKRKSEREDVFDSEKVCRAEGYKIIDSNILEQSFNSICKCPFCGTGGAITLNQNNKKRKGLCEKLEITCNSCKNIIKKIDTSPSVTDARRKMVDINLRSVVATTSTGGGLTAL